jgi:hypothetical protein
MLKIAWKNEFLQISPIALRAFRYVANQETMLV